jgi:hypothetical protein
MKPRNPNTPPIPVGMKFHRLLAADKRDIMPTVESPDYTPWRIVSTRETWGWSVPGWKYPGDPQVYAVRKR